MNARCTVPEAHCHQIFSPANYHDNYISQPYIDNYISPPITVINRITCLNGIIFGDMSARRTLKKHAANVKSQQATTQVSKNWILSL